MEDGMEIPLKTRNKTPYDLAIPLLGMYPEVKVTQSYPTLCNSKYYSQPGSSSMEFSRQEYWSGLPCPPPGDLPNPGIKLQSPALQADSLPTEPPEKPKNTGVGSLLLLQRVFSTEELNWGLLHCRQILYQLSYHGSQPFKISVISSFTCNSYPLSVFFRWLPLFWHQI